MNTEELAEHITNEIFNCSDETGMKCTRIQFMAKTSFGEVGRGGFCKTALKRFIKITIENSEG